MSSPILNRYEPSDVLYIRAQLVTSAVLVNAGNSFISHPGTSWPSCYEPIGDDVNSKLDKSIIYMPVMEVLRSRLRCPSWYNVDDDGPPLV
ncbi:hypothetical protein MUK42_14596 [Musa troglodytarum]|uniref:Uncharacterized protein n=1 Tax=Musa troglodytarum TaxID=320322 RepID=A0A9E7L3D0_9LILI|nr:hypothetical protein MUK42_14596 [Musa troglodytarum]